MVKGLGFDSMVKGLGFDCMVKGLGFNSMDSAKPRRGSSASMSCERSGAYNGSDGLGLGFRLPSEWTRASEWNGLERVNGMERGNGINEWSE